MVRIYDTTLRDGLQREGVSLTVEDRLRIVTKLDALGIPLIEGGYPASNAKEAEFFEKAHALKLGQARLVAFGSTRRKDRCVERDEGLSALLASGCTVVDIVGKAHAQHVEVALETTREENLQMVRDSVSYLLDAGRTVHFSAEHYFDGYLFDRDYARHVVLTAARVGARAVILCDTNGGSLPFMVEEIVSDTRMMLDENGFSEVEIGIHAHDDAGCGVANTLMAIRAGATLAMGTINGYGERVGNADLTTVIADLVLKMGEDVISHAQLAQLTSTAHFVAAVFNDSLDPHHPYVGTSAFAHKGGLHVSAQQRMPGAYEHVDPAQVGNFAHVVVSELAGRASLIDKAHEFGIELEGRDAATASALAEIKKREHDGYSYELADASLALLVESHLAGRPEYFDLESFRVIADKYADGRVMTEATIKIHVGDERFIATGEGNGPVNALDVALRAAITRFYPEIDAMNLTDYKVRVLDESRGTDAVTRVIIQTGDGEDSWGSVGVSENIIEASWMALVDAITYGLFRKGSAWKRG